MIGQLILEAGLETIYMVAFGTLFAVLAGTPIGLILYVTREGGLAPNKLVYSFFDIVVNILRSVPYIIMMILLIPITQFFLNTMIGPTAMIFSLAVSAAPFFARLLETALLDLDPGVLEAAQAMGASNGQIIFKVLLPEALPALVAAITTTIINLISYTAMAGALGGGGLGALAVRYGYHRRQTDVLIISVVVIVIMVQLVQFIGSFIAKKINKR